MINDQATHPSAMRHAVSGIPASATRAANPAANRAANPAATRAANPAATRAANPAALPLRDVARAHVNKTRLYRAALVAGMLAVAATALLTTDGARVAASEVSFVRMMRAMATIKALLVTIAAAVLWWRFARPVPTLFAIGYLSGAWAMIAATVLIWQLSSIGAAAIVFHTGELSLLLLAWRDNKS